MNGGAEYSLRVKAIADSHSFNEVKKSFQEIINAYETKAQSAGEAEAKKFQKTADSIKTLQKAYEQAFNSNLGTLNLQKLNIELQKIGKNKNALREIGKAYEDLGREGSRGMQLLTANILGTNKNLVRTKTLFDELAVTMTNTVKWGLSSSLMNSFTGSISEAYSYIKNLDKSLNNIRIVSEKSAKDMEIFAQSANKAAQSLGATTLDYTNASLIYYQQGLTEDEVAKRTETTVKLANVLGVTAEEASNYMTAIWNNFDDGSQSIEYYADVITKLGAATASSAEEISAGLEKFAAVSKTVGLSYEYATAALTTVTAQTRQSADVVGTAFKTLFARIQDLELGKTLDDGTTLGKYSEALRKVGIDIKDASGNLKDMDTILDEMGSTWGILSDAQKVALAQTVAGTRQYTQLIALMDNWSIFTKNVEMATGATGELNKEQSIYLESTTAHINEATAAWDEFKTSLLDAKTVNFFADMSKLTGNFANLLTSSIGGGLPTALLLGSSALRGMSGQLGKQTANLMANKRIPVENEEKNKEIQNTINLLKQMGLERDADVKKIIVQKEKVLEYGDLIDQTQEEELNGLLKKQAELQVEIDLWKEKLEVARGFIVLADQGQTASRRLSERELGGNPKNVTSAIADEKAFTLDASTKDTSILGIQENFKISKDVTTEMNKSLKEWIENVNSIQEDLVGKDFGLFSKNGEPIPTKDGLFQSWRAAGFEQASQWTGISEQDAKDFSATNPVNVLKSYEGFFKAIDEQLVQQIQKHSKKLQKEFKAISGDTVDEKTVNQLTKETKQLTKELNTLLEKAQLKMNDINQTIYNENADFKVSMDQSELERVEGQTAQELSKLSDISKSEAWFEFAGSVGQLASGATATVSAFSSLGDETLSSWEKLARIFTGLTIGATAFVNGMRAYSAVAPKIVVALKEQAIVEELLNAANAKGIKLTQQEITTEMMLNYVKQQGLLTTTKQILAAGVRAVKESIVNAVLAVQALLQGNVTALGIAATAVIIGLATGVIYFTSKLIEANTAEGRLERQLEKNNKVLEKSKEEYEEINNTINNYKNARNSLEDLEEGTYEWYEAIHKANEEAQKLIEQWDLIAGKDYTLGPSGLIQINEQSLQEKQFEEQQKVFRAQANVSETKLDLVNLGVDDIIQEFKNAVNKNKQSLAIGATLNDEQSYRILQDLEDGYFKNEELGHIFTSGINNLSEDMQGSFCTQIKITKEIEEYLPRYEMLLAEIQNLNAQYGTELIHGYGTQGQVEAFNKATAEQQKAMSVAVATGVKEYDKNNKDIDGTMGWTDILGNTLATVVFGALGAMYTTYDAIRTKQNAKIIKDAYATSVKQWEKVGDDWFDKYGNIVTDQYNELKAKDLEQSYNDGEFETQRLLQEQLDQLTQIKINTSGQGFNTTSQNLVANAILGLKAGTATKKDFELLTDKEKNYIAGQFNKTYTVSKTKVWVPNPDYDASKDPTAKKDPNQLYKDAQKWREGKQKGETAPKTDNKLERQIQGWYEDKTEIKTNYEGLSDEISNKKFESWTATDGDSNEKNTARLEEQTSQYNKTLAEQSDALKTSATALELYGYSLEKAGKISKERDADTAQQTANLYKFNKAFNTARKVYKDNTEAIDDYVNALKNNEEVSYDVADAMAEMIEPLEDMLGFDIDAAFIDKYSKQIKELVSGTEKEAKRAYEELAKIGRQMALEEAFDLDLSLPVEQLSADGKTVKDILNSINNVGWNGTFSGDMLSSLLDMIENAKMTTAEVEQLFKGLHLEMPVVDNSEFLKSVNANNPTVEYVETPESVKKHRYVGQMPNPKNPEENVEVDYTWEEIVQAAKIPYVSWTKEQKEAISQAGLKGTGLGGSFKQANTSKGSKSKPKQEKHQEDKKDIYHDVNIELAKISNNIEKLQTAEDQLVGQSRIDNLRQQYAELNKEIEKTGEKIDIAKGEMADIQSDLANKGITFNADGTIANYAAAYDAQLAYLNGVISHYNSLSADGQESYQTTLDAAKEGFEKFKEDIERYDEILTDMIPGLEADIQDAINEQIEMKIDAFHQEIELRLDMAEAEREWNEFYKNIIKDIDEDDILGNATERLKDFMSYYKESTEGVIQVNTEHINQILSELKAMDENGVANVYGKDETEYQKQALEDLQNYYQQLMSDLTDIHDLSDEIHESYVDMIDEAQEKFDEQIETFERVNELLEHDKNVISMIYGEESYSALAQYYDKQEENNNKQLDFQKQQVEFWKQQMEIAEEGSDAWEAAKENWMSAVDEWNSAVEAAIENLQEKYLNAINAIFQNLNNQVTNGLGLDYTESQWELINKNADQYLDSVNSIYQVQQLQNKYLDAIEKTDSPAQQKRLNDLMKQETDYLREQDKLSQYDLDRANLKYEIALKQMALEEAQQNKTMLRLRRDSQGNYTYQYTADEDQISSIQQEIADLYNQLYNLDAEEYRGNLEEIYDVWLEFQERMTEAAQINDPEQRAAKELLIKEQYGELINTLVEKNENTQANLYQSTMSHLFDLYNQNIVNYDEMSQEQRDILDQFMSTETDLSNAAFDNLFNLYNVNIESFKTMTDEQQEILMGSLVPQWDTAVQMMVDNIAGAGGFLPTCREAFEEIDAATQDYMSGLEELQEKANISFEDVKNGIDETIIETEKLLEDNNELISSYEQEIEAIRGVIDELEELISKYQAASDAAKKATEDAYNYWLAEQDKNATIDATLPDPNEGTSTTTNETPQPAAPIKTPKPSLNVGSYVNVKAGSRWYRTSYGGGDGPARSGSIVLTNPGSNYPYNIDWLGWVSKSSIQGYDTGGYTGDWGSKDGRLAMLHQKELVLNASDTQNVLNAVEILRDITSNLGNTLFSRMAAISAGGASAIANGVAAEGIEQNVHIDAQFPNVTNSHEIEDALNNLMNRASQFIQQSR